MLYRINTLFKSYSTSQFRTKINLITWATRLHEKPCFNSLYFWHCNANSSKL